MLRATLCFSLTFATALPARAEGLDTVDENVLVARVPLAAVEGGPRRWQAAAGGALLVHDAPSDRAPVIEGLADGTILDNLGCTMADDRVWCEVQTLRGKLRGYSAAEHLHPARGADGAVPMGTDDSPRRAAKGDFDARSEIACAQIRDQRMEQCTVGVARGTGGDATVVARFSNGFRRTLRFVHGEFISANATMSGVGTDVDWQLDGDLHRIRVDDQRYELDDAFIFGG